MARLFGFLLWGLKSFFCFVFVCVCFVAEELVLVCPAELVVKGPFCAYLHYTYLF